MPGNKKNRRKKIQKAKRADRAKDQKRCIALPDHNTGKLAIALLVAHAISNKPTY